MSGRRLSQFPMPDKRASGVFVYEWPAENGIKHVEALLGDLHLSRDFCMAQVMSLPFDLIEEGKNRMEAELLRAEQERAR